MAIIHDVNDTIALLKHTRDFMQQGGSLGFMTKKSCF